MSSLKNQQRVQKLAEKFKVMKGLIVMEYHGINVEEISDLRSKLCAFGSEYTVVKNTLSKIALKQVGIDVGGNFSGPTALVVDVNDNIMSSAKVVVEFIKSNSKLKIKAGFLEGKFISASELVQLSSLPSKEVLIVRALGGMKAPVTGFVSILAANIKAFVTVLEAKAAKKQVA
jgi:large subunit ribosomal protein L10